MDGKPEIEAALLVELAADIVSAYVGNHVVPVGELPKLISDVHDALSGTVPKTDNQVAVEKPVPKVPVRKSIHDDYLICLEDGQKFKSLKRHLMTHYQMTPEQYREKWDLRIIRWSPPPTQKRDRNWRRKWAWGSAGSGAAR